MNTSWTDRPATEGLQSSSDSARQGQLPTRVVVLTTSTVSIAPLQGIEIELVTAATAYEATAEILAAPTVALVVDLRLVGERHLRLLEIARKMETEVLAVGAVPAGLTGEDLSGVRLTARAEVGSVLGRLVRNASQEISTAAAEPPDERDCNEPEPDDPIFESVTGEPTSASIKDMIDSALNAENAQAEESSPGPGHREPDGPDDLAAPARNPSSLLTPEELSALLEDEL